MASVTRNRVGHRERRSAAAQRILDAAEALLRGGDRFTEIPVERLLLEADVSRSTFYVHFADKSEVLAQLAERALLDVKGAAELWWHLDHTVGPRPAARTIRGMIKAYRRHAEVLRALSEVSAYDENVRGLWRMRTAEYIATTTKRMHIEQDAGLIAPDADVEYAAASIIRLVDGEILEHIFHGMIRDDGRLARSLARAGWLARYGRIPQPDA